MVQEKIVEILEKSKVPLSLAEIAEIVNQTDQLVSKALSQMLKYQEIKCMELNKDLAMKFYKCKRRMRLFYI